jgi:glutathione S-transferase
MAPTLYYWGIKARGQLAVLLGRYSGQEFEWNRTPDWPGLKPETPFGQLPLLVDGEVKIAQSNAIARYLGRKYGLQGNSDADFALSELLIEEQVDLNNIVFKANYSPNKNESFDKVFAEEYPAQLAFLEKLLTNDFFTSELTTGSLAIFNAFNLALDLQPTLLDNYPKLKAFYERVSALPAIKAYLDENVAPYLKRD